MSNESLFFFVWFQRDGSISLQRSHEKSRLQDQPFSCGWWSPAKATQTGRRTELIATLLRRPVGRVQELYLSYAGTSKQTNTVKPVLDFHNQIWKWRGIQSNLLYLTCINTMEETVYRGFLVSFRKLVLWVKWIALIIMLPDI